MKRLAELEDDQYPSTGIKQTRDIVRAILLDEKGNVAIHLVKRDDRFGKQTYYETPGGGVDAGESHLQALARECQEETGYTIEVIAEIGEVIDYYNLIGRKNLNHFYLARRKQFVGKHLVSQGDSYIQKTLWVPLKEAIELYKKMPDDLVSGLVKKREMPVLLQAGLLLEGK